MTSVGVNAQNVTVKSTNGNTLPAVKGSGEDALEDAFFSMGGFAMWKHNQLNLTMTTADSDGAEMSNGQFKNPANNIFKSSGEALQLGRGRSIDCYVAFSLPKGYRFTGYTIVFRRNIDKGAGSLGNASFGETTSSWDWYNNNTHKTGLAYSASATKQTITRESTSAEDMGNVLYFKLTNDQNSRNGNTRAYITLESIELFFTAEADYTPVVPAGSFLNKTAVDIPFSTSCIDIGTLESRHYNGVDRISYSYQNVKDLMGQMTLYEENSHTSGTNFDGTSGEVVAYNDNGTISSQDNYFKVGKAEGQTYFLETPTYLELTNNARTKNPIGYRIVGAEIKYKYGTKQNAHNETVTKEVLVDTKQYRTFYISGTVDLYSYSYWERSWTHIGNTKYYLTSSAEMSTDESKKAIWFMDDDGYIRLAINPDKYLKNQTINSTQNRLAVVGKNDSPAKYAINGSGQITLKANGNMYLSLNTTSETHGIINSQTHITNVNYFQIIENGGTKATRTETGNETSVNIFETQTETLEFPEFNPSAFTITVYDREGGTDPDKGYKQKTVNSSADDGSITLDGLNNDAIKFSVTGVGLIQGVLTIQALDPYIDRIDIVCEEASKPTGSSTYTPTTNGGKLTQQFTASDFAVSGGAFYFYVPSTFTESCLLTFKNLYSKYGDNTYYNGSTSGNSRYNFVMSTYWNSNANLYANTYSPNHTYQDKIDANVVGDHAYLFNNAAAVGANGGNFEEYPFTLAKYGGASKFGQMVFTQDEISGNNAKQKTAYLFTCDETRYNIAPTTATQHRFYAFYKMDVTVSKRTYDAVFEWIKVYDKSCTLDSNGGINESPLWGLELRTDNIGTTQEPKFGYLLVSTIVNKINKDVKAGNTDKPTSKDQILYIDASKLSSVVQDRVTTNNVAVNYNYSKLKEGMGQNVFVFLPAGRTSDLNNFAIKTDAGLFRAANNIILTDKHPFFVPYDIQVPEANYATYTRQISGAGNKLAKYATIMMPFTLNVTNGLHTNETEDGFQFYLRKMNNFTGTLVTGSNNNYYDEANFNKITGEKAAANTPYMVEVVDQKSTEYSFIASQKGSNIVATPKVENSAKGKMKIKGETVNGLTNFGTYSGVSEPTSKVVYYFNRDKYVSSQTLDARYTHVYVQPFRAYYDTSSSGAKMIGFNIVYDLFSDNDGITTSLNETSQPKVMTISTGNGSMLITANENIQVKIMGTNGLNVDSFNMNAGEQKLVNVPSGIYIVNNTKILVK